MSSAAFSRLTLELKAPWILLAGLAGWLLLVVYWIWQSEAPLALQSILTLIALAVGPPVLSTQLFGIAPWALRRVSLLADGSWRLSDGRGREWSATLAGSRSVRGCVLLLWKSGSVRHWAMVVRQRDGRDAFRRLRVRLNSLSV